MQYILTEAEYKALAEKSDALKEATRKTVQDLCTKVANHMPIRWTWGEGAKKARPWGCIITARASHREWYCDQCPVRIQCPFESKEYSK